MAKEDYTIIVVSPKLTRIKKYRFSRFFPRFLIFSLFLILLGLSFTLYDLMELKVEVFNLDLLRRQNISQRVQIQWFTVKVNDLKKNMARLNAFERKIRITANLQNPATYNRLSGVGGPQAEEHLLSSLLNKEHEQLESEIPTETASSDRIVGIRNLKTFAGGDPIKLNIKFDLYKVSSQHRIAKGWTIMVASADRAGSLRHVSYPRTKLRIGVPIDIKIGDSFAIRRFKKVEGYFDRPSIDVRFNKVTIFVYNSDKNLILKEVFPIADGLNPSSFSLLSK